MTSGDYQGYYEEMYKGENNLDDEHELELIVRPYVDKVENGSLMRSFSNIRGLLKLALNMVGEKLAIL